MSRIFSRTRSAELSLFNYITTQVNANWTNIPVINDFQQAYDNPARPIICVGMGPVATKRQELGSNLLKQDFSFTIDIFANSDGQRLDLDDFIVNTVIVGCPYYDYSKSGNTIVPSAQNGNLSLRRFISDIPIKAGPDSPVEDRFRQSITFTMVKYA